MRKFFALLPVIGMLAVSISGLQAATGVKLNAWTVPSSGTAGTSTVNLGGSGYPAGTIAPGSITLSFSSTCKGTAAATASPATVTPIVGTSDNLTFLVPASLATGTYFISLTGATYSSTNCAEITVQAPIKFSGACLPTSSLGVLVNSSAKTVTSYVPNGAWDAGNTGVQVVPIEPVAAPATVSTPATVNSCSSNPATGQTVCTANNTDVYLLSGSTLTNTLTSGASATIDFTGGTCENCGVAVNSATNQAVIAIGNSGSNGGIQFLNLNNNTFGPPIALATEESENIAWDITRGLITSSSENGVYDLLKIGSGGTVQEFGQFVGGTLDSAAEDCTTGIILSTSEFTGDLYIADLTQATFTPGTPGTWTAPGQTVTFPEFGNLAAGTSGMSVAPGSHFAVVAGEFGGNLLGAVQLPSTSGSGTPAFVDYVAVTLPSTPDGCSFSNGFDPHTVTAYTSPNTGKAYGLLADWGSGVPDYLGIVDLAALMSAPRTAGTHTVSASVDLIGSGIVTYVPTGNANCGGGSVGGDAAVPTSSRPKIPQNPPPPQAPH